MIFLYLFMYVIYLYSFIVSKREHLCTSAKNYLYRPFTIQENSPFHPYERLRPRITENIIAYFCAFSTPNVNFTIKKISFGILTFGLKDWQ